MTGRGDFSGHYDGKPISVSCSTTSGFLAVKIQCMVFVGNERAATLLFYSMIPTALVVGIVFCRCGGYNLGYVIMLCNC